jgi:hypothetical protein
MNVYVNENKLSHIYNVQQSLISTFAHDAPNENIHELIHPTNTMQTTAPLFK